ncbi:Uncharacterized protein BM_BM9287 [Brugia malayi]|uniref:Bm9287 n=2 Tax=Brugia malayi TaxID=6279 RepID=A0A4E9F8Y0_BRUMA|nr:Uncharacterized protein BM_BM9287 [Brugia malayi]VIO90369.1 Uncharacterized protein BM_BM9287 [Brugia malayi]
MAVNIILKYFPLLIIILPWCSSLIDIRHRFELPQIPTDLKEQILAECKSTFVKFFQPHKHKTMSQTTIKIDVSNASMNEMLTNTTKMMSHETVTSSSASSQQCPMAINNCILTKTSPFLEHCDVKCLTATDKSLSNDLHCWNDNCFIRATRICEEKFWRTVSVKNRKKKKKRMRCITEIKHCYKLACLKCLGRECNINCYGGGIQYISLTKPRWKGYDEYKKFFPEIKDIVHKFVLVPEKMIIIEDYNE